jgi:hypothetical protein
MRLRVPQQDDKAYTTAVSLTNVTAATKDNSALVKAQKIMTLCKNSAVTGTMVLALL